MTDIVLIGRNDERHQAKPPADFNWAEYPAVLYHGGEIYEYVGTIDGTPHYRTTAGRAQFVRIHHVTSGAVSGQ